MGDPLQRIPLWVSKENSPRVEIGKFREDWRDTLGLKESDSFWKRLKFYFEGKMVERRASNVVTQHSLLGEEVTLIVNEHQEGWVTMARKWCVAPRDDGQKHDRRMATGF